MIFKNNKKKVSTNNLWHKKITRAICSSYYG
nr:MAG TPA: hypothetical protein [Bacteriophage sp.]